MNEIKFKKQKNSISEKDGKRHKENITSILTTKEEIVNLQNLTFLGESQSRSHRQLGKVSAKEFKMLIT